MCRVLTPRDDPVANAGARAVNRCPELIDGTTPAEIDGAPAESQCGLAVRFVEKLRGGSAAPFFGNGSEDSTESTGLFPGKERRKFSGTTDHIHGSTRGNARGTHRQRDSSQRNHLPTTTPRTDTQLATATRVIMNYLRNWTQLSESGIPDEFQRLRLSYVTLHCDIGYTERKTMSGQCIIYCTVFESRTSSIC